MHGHAGGFVDDHQIVIVMDDVEGQILGQGGGVDRRWQGDADHPPGLTGAEGSVNVAPSVVTFPPMINAFKRLRDRSVGWL